MTSLRQAVTGRPNFDLQSHSTHSDGHLPAAEVVAACDAVRAEERALLDLITAPGFSVEKLRQWKLTH